VKRASAFSTVVSWMARTSPPPAWWRAGKGDLPKILSSRPRVYRGRLSRA